MSPDAKKQDLLYVADGNNGDVYVYSYPQGKLTGTLTGFNDPAGLCVDKKGDVFITENYGHDILEYAHGGTTKLQTLGDSVYQAYDCKVDPKSGDLAVANVVTEYFTKGDLAVFAKAKGVGVNYSLPTLWFSCNTVGYDNKGDVYMEGNGYSSQTYAGVLPKGGSTVESLSLNQSIGSPGETQWDGKYMTFADRNTGDIYQFTISGSSGTEVGSTTISPTGEAQWSWIQGKTVIIPLESGSGEGVNFYAYPAGGSATMTLLSGQSLDGVTVSLAKKKK